MHRIDSVGATGDSKFKTTPLPATRVDAAWLTAVQEELVNIVVNPLGGDTVLVKANTGQVLAAILATITRAIGASITGGANANGYWTRHADGTIEQRGTVLLPITSVNTSDVHIAFPTDFTDPSTVRVACTAAGKPSNTWSGVSVSLWSDVEEDGVDIRGDTCAGADTNGRFFNAVAVHWIAVGK